ncbi:MAG TPA: S9 family peptidase [Xanthomonadaceae bacterium]|nr:S9 family peptidase [Xanthomonadaceae bacterium]
MMRTLALLLGLLLAPTVLANDSLLPIRDYVRDAEFTEAQLSPDGSYLAITVPRDDRTTLAVLNVADLSVASRWDFGTKTHAERVVWVTNKRFLVYVSHKEGRFDFRTGEPNLFATNFDGTQRKMIPNGGTYRLLDELRDNRRRVLVQRNIDQPMLFTMDTFSGRITAHAYGPQFGQSFVLDHEQNPRYAFGSDRDDRFRSYVWNAGSESWEEFDRQQDFIGGFRRPLALHRDGQRVYMAVSDDGEPSRIELYDPVGGEREVLFRSDSAEFDFLLRSVDRRDIFGLAWMPDVPQYHFFDPEHEDARLLRSLLAAFPEHHVSITSRTWDGKQAVVRVSSDVDPGSLYLFDTDTLRARFLLANRPWIDPKRMAPMRPLRLTARDGEVLHGYLTLPPGSDGRNLPLIVNPHGGPHGPRDRWGFNREVQLLASRGYAVLQVNFRGSGGYGTRFERIGYRHWGSTMQDDLIDAVNFVVSQGVADADRICIYGASYGGYAALMNVVRAPELYRCTIGYVGVYSLPMMLSRGDIPRGDFGRRYLTRAIGRDRDELHAFSPVFHVDRIQIPVMLVHGRLDQRVPIHQFYALEKALNEAGRPPLTLVKDREGHGFWDLDNNVELYTMMLDFLDTHIGEGAGRRRAVAQAEPD